MFRILQVKAIVTVKRLTSLISAIGFYQLCFVLLNFIRTGPPYDVATPRRTLYMMCCFTIPSLLCFPIVLISTFFLIVRLKQSLKWRDAAINQSKSDSSKEKKVARSVIFICSLFIICFLPNILTLTLSAAYEEFNVFSPYLKWLVHIFYIFNFFFQTLNSSLNMLIYYSMSSKFCEVFKDVFLPNRSKNSS